MSVGRCTMSHMNALAALGMLLALAAGTALGWLLHAARSGDRAARAEAQLVALRENEALLQQSLGAVSEDSARRHSGAIGEQISRLVGPLHEAVGALAEQALNNVECHDVAVYPPVRAAQCPSPCHRCRDRRGGPPMTAAAVVADRTADVDAPDLSRLVIRAFVYVLDPKPGQVEALWSHCGAQRFAYNWALSRVKANLDQRAAERSYEILNSELTPLVSWSAYSLRKHWNTVKNDVTINSETGQPWWPENSKEAYSSGLANCAAALSNWSDARSGKRKGSMGFPRFRSKRAVPSCRFTTGSFGLVTDGGDRRHVQLPRIGAIRTCESTRKRLQAMRGQLGSGRRPSRIAAAGGRCRSPSRPRSPPGHSHPPVPPRSAMAVWAVRWLGSMSE